MAKQLYPNIVRGGMAIPLGNNYYFMKGRKHNQGGIDIGKDLEVEGGEIMKLDENNVKVFSAVPFLNGKSPVEKILGGENPNKVFAQQERFKKVNKINDDGTKAKYGKRKINTETIPESEQYAVTTPDGQRKVFNNKVEAQQYITANTPKGYSLYDTTNYGSNIDKGQTAILDRNTEREIEKATEKEIRTNARKANIESNKEYAMEALNAMPIIGDGMDIYSIVKDAYNKNYGNAALTAGMMLVPFDKLLKPVGKGIKKLYNKARKKSNVKFTDNFDVNSDNKSYEELAEEYADSWFELDNISSKHIKSSKDINTKNLQNITDEEWDELYNKAIKNNDLKEAQNLRDLHFKQKTPNNKIINKQYHVVGDNYDPNFTIFDPKENHTSIYTTDNIDMASSYSKYWLSDEEKLKALSSLREEQINDKNKIVKELQKELNYRQNNNKSNNYIYENTESLKNRLDAELKELELLNDDNNFQNYFNFYNTIAQPNRVKKLNVYLENPIQIDNGGNNWNNIRISNLPKDVYDNIKVDRRGNFLDSRYSTLSLENVSKDLGYDGVIIDNVTDYGKHWGNKYINFNTPNQVVITNDKNKLKLADAITYDDNGNIIPLSKRDDFTNPDIRFNWLLPTIGIGTGLSLINNNENNQYKYGGEKINNENNIDYIYDKIDKSNKNFAKRLRDKNRKHITNWEDTTQISTHKLGVATDNKGNHYIYPEVQEVNGRLVDYTRPPFNRTAGMIHAEKTGDTVRVNSIEDGIKFTQEYKNRYMNKKQLGGKANIYRLDSNGKSDLRMNISTGDETKARKKGFLGIDYNINKVDPKDIKINYSQGLKDYLKNATTIKPSINWNKIGTAIKPYAGSIIDTVGNIATSLINASTLNKMKYTKQPIPRIANKLKTSVNINPQLKTLNESYNQYTDYINNNTASSKVAREALQRARIKNVLDTNTLYATKENTETELINKDRINQQTVANANVDNYNKWLVGKAEFDNAILDKKSENIVGAINNITSSFNTSINNIKKDRQFNNNLISVLAANPNVNPEYLRALGADWVTDKMIEDWKLANKKK